MTRFSDNIYSGNVAITSALSSYGMAVFTKVIKLNAANKLKTVTFPPYIENLDAKLFITTNGSAATTDRINVSATTGVAGILLQFTAMGSSAGCLYNSTTGLGGVGALASACAKPWRHLNITSDLTLNIGFTQTDDVTEYSLVFYYNRIDDGRG